MKLFSTPYFAHRGLHNDHSIAPENSIEAFRRAVDSGFGIELDVQRTKDGKIVVFHDYNLLRVCGADRFIYQHTYEELTQYTLYDSKERIPLFEDVLKLIGGKVPLLIELKIRGTDRELCEKTAAYLDHYPGDYCVESFNPYALFWFRTKRPAVRVGQLATDFIKYEGESPLYLRVLMQILITNYFTDPDFIAMDYNLCDWFLYRLHTRRRARFGWTFRSAAELQEYRDKFDCFIFEQKFSS